MTTRKFFETVLIYLSALVLFVFFDYFFHKLTDSVFLTFTITIFLLIVFQPFILKIIRKFLLRKSYLLTTRAQRILEKLNNDLNKATRYDEVTKDLFETFKQLFGDIPHIFYILEDDKYYPEHCFNVNDSELIAFDLKSEYLEGVDLNELIVKGFKNTALPSEFVERAKAADLTTILPFRGHTHIFAFLLINHQKIPFFGDRDAWKLMEKIQKKAGLILENTALIVDLENRNYQTRKLLEVGQKILSSFDIKTILDFILITLKKVAHYDAAAIFLLDKTGKQLLNTSSDGYNPEIIENMHLKVGQGSCGWVVQSRQIEVIDDVRNAKHYYPLRRETRSQCSIPLIFDDKVLGVICLESNRLAYFNKQLVDLLQLFAQMASIAIHNAHQFRIMLDKQALEHELINAGKIQKALLVQRFPSIRHLSITAMNIPSKIVSGDLYDIIKYDDHTVGIAIADVVGKGAPAAITMALVLAGLRSQKQFFMTACDIVYRLNNLLYESTIEGNYVSFFYALISTEKKRIVFTNAGHNPPILIRRDGTITFLQTGGIVIGFQPNIEYKQEELEFEPGDIILLYTDGITEAMNTAEEEFGQERLIDLLLRHKNKNVYEIRQIIVQKVREFTGKETMEDDMTLLLCKYE